MELIQFRTEPRCTLCPLHAFARSRCVPTIRLPPAAPTPPRGRALVFVGQNPGFNEDQQNEPFVGRSGTMVRQDFTKALRLDQHPDVSIYLTNTARCYTPTESPPTKSQYATCARHYLLPDLLAILQAHGENVAVVALGAPAASHIHALCGHKNISLSKALAHPAKTLLLPNPDPQHPTGHPYIFTFFAAYHPSYIMRQPSAALPLAEQLSHVLDWLQGRALTPSAPTRVPPFPPTGSTP